MPTDDLMKRARRLDLLAGSERSDLPSDEDDRGFEKDRETKKEPNK